MLLGAALVSAGLAFGVWLLRRAVFHRSRSLDLGAVSEAWISRQSGKME